MENLNYFTQPIISPLSRMGSFYEPFSIDAIINSTVQNRAETLRPKIREFYLQKQTEEQNEKLATEQEKQKQLGATMSGLRRGIEMLSAPKYTENKEIGGQNTGEKAAQEAGRQEAQSQAGEDVLQTNRGYETTKGNLEEAVKDLDIGAYEKAIGALPGLAQNAMGAYDVYNKIESGSATPEDYANLGLTAMGTGSNLLKAVGDKGGSLYNAGTSLGGAAGAIGGGLGIAQGVQGIINNPNDPSNYINTGVSGTQAYQGITRILNPSTASVPSPVSGVGASPLMSGLMGISGAYNISQGSKNPVDYMAAGGAGLQAAGAGLSALGAAGAGTAASAAGSSLASATPWGAIGAAVHGAGESLAKEGGFTGRLGRGMAGGTGDFLSENQQTAGALSALAADPTHSVHRALDLGLEQGDYEGALKAFAIEPFEDMFGW